MASDYIHFVRRRVRLVQVAGTNPAKHFYAELQSDLDGLRRPRFHTTRALTGSAARIRAGDTIWLLAQLVSPWGKLPPSLDARIDVAGQPRTVQDTKRTRGHAEGQRLRFEAAGTSRWFPLADATATLLDLRSRNARGAVAPLLEKGVPVGQVLRRIRQLESGQPLRAWETHLDSLGFDFVSYRLKDGTAAAFAKVHSIIQQGGAAFWDRWSLPRRLAERREKLNAPALDVHLEEQIKIAKTVWAIPSRHYGEPGSYSDTESKLAEHLGKLERVPA